VQQAAGSLIFLAFGRGWLQQLVGVCEEELKNNSIEYSLHQITNSLNFDEVQTF